MLETIDTAPITDMLMLAYLDRLQRLDSSHHTTKQHRQTARRFQAYLHDVRTTAALVEGWQLEEFFEGMTDLAVSTRRSHLRRMQAWYRYALRRGAVLRDPTVDVELPRIPDSEPRVIENDTLRRYLRDVRDDQGWAQFHLLAYTGLRRQECIDLQWADLDFVGTTLTVLSGKGGKMRKVPLHPVLGEALQGLTGPRDGAVIRPKRQAPRIGGDTWDAILRSYTGGEHTAHDFRRTVASSLALNGVADPLIDKILGWAARSVGRRYYIKIAGPELQRAILRLYSDDPL